MTATIAPTGAVQVVGWGDDAAWLLARQKGISASDVAAVLGFGPYRTPWEVWAEQTGVRAREVDASREAIRLGVALEPWLLRQAGHLAGAGPAEVQHTAGRLYAHPQFSWRLASPDGVLVGPDGNVLRGIEAKTAGLASGFGVPDSWSDDRAPLGYELQCRWQMHVLGWDHVELIALVAGLGLRRYSYARDPSVEADMVAQVAEWRDKHLVRGVEPPMGAADNSLMDAMFRSTSGGEVRLDDVDDLTETLLEYHDGLAREAAGRALKEAATARLKRLLGDNAVGTVANQVVVTWNAKQGKVDYQALVEDLVEVLGWDGPLLDMEQLLNNFRKPDTRSISVKGLPA